MAELDALRRIVDQTQARVALARGSLSRATLEYNMAVTKLCNAIMVQTKKDLNDAGNE